jgi:hypothetical protein
MKIKRIIGNRYCFEAPVGSLFPQDSTVDADAWFNPRIDSSFFEPPNQSSLTDLLLALEAPHRALSYTSFMCQMRFFAARIYSHLLLLGERAASDIPEFKNNPIDGTKYLDQIISYFHSKAAPIFEIHALYYAKELLEEERKRGKYLDLKPPDEIVQTCLENLEKKLKDLSPSIREMYVLFERAAKKVGSYYPILVFTSLDIPIVYWLTGDQLQRTRSHGSDFEGFMFIDPKLIEMKYRPEVYDPWFRFVLLVKWINAHPNVGIFKLTGETFLEEVLFPLSSHFPLFECGVENGKFCLCQRVESYLGLHPSILNNNKPFKWLAKDTLSCRKAKKRDFEVFRSEHDRLRYGMDIGTPTVTFLGESPIWKDGIIRERQCYLVLLDSIYQQLLEKIGIFCPWEHMCNSGYRHVICEKMRIKQYLDGFCLNIKKYNWGRLLDVPPCLKKK